MTRICIDTNRYLAFYRVGLSDTKHLDELARYKKNLVVPRQIINEFRRNRAQQLEPLIMSCKRAKDLQAPYAPVMRHLSDYEKLTSVLDSYKKSAQQVKQSLEKFIDETNDLVAQRIFALWLDGDVTKLETSDALVDKAFRRKLQGNPPTSPDKYSACDELIWEVLLSEMKDDLILVSDDHTFLDNELLLKEEFKGRTSKNLIMITKDFSRALKEMGESPSESLLEAEKSMIYVTADEMDLRNRLRQIELGYPERVKHLLHQRAAGEISSGTGDMELIQGLQVELFMLEQEALQKGFRESQDAIAKLLDEICQFVRKSAGHN